MHCKNCQAAYGVKDDARYSNCDPLGHHNYGWLPTFGLCFLCFCFDLFEGFLEPLNRDWTSIYGINCDSEVDPRQTRGFDEYCNLIPWDDFETPPELLP
jgi:hypothetical protein